jgi:hypothetical protein
MAPTRTEALPPVELWTTTSLLVVALLDPDNTNPADGNEICQRQRHLSGISFLHFLVVLRSRVPGWVSGNNQRCRSRRILSIPSLYRFDFPH